MSTPSSPHDMSRIDPKYIKKHGIEILLMVLNIGLPGRALLLGEKTHMSIFQLWRMNTCSPMSLVSLASQVRASWVFTGVLLELLLLEQT